MNTEPLDVVPLWLLFIAECVLSGLALDAGYRLGRWRHLRAAEEKETPVGAMVGSILALFAFMQQRVPVRIAIEKDDRWPLLRAGLSVRAVIGHGAGDPQWAAQAAREMADLEARYNRAKE
jgi:hypothetical protein